GHEVRAIEDTERILGLQFDRLEPGGAQRVSALPPLPLDAYVALADQHEADMRRWGEVAAGAERAFLRHPGTDVVIEQVDHPLRNDGAHPRGALAELVDADQHPGAHQL